MYIWRFKDYCSSRCCIIAASYLLSLSRHFIQQLVVIHRGMPVRHRPLYSSSPWCAQAVKVPIRFFSKPGVGHRDPIPWRSGPSVLAWLPYVVFVPFFGGLNECKEARVCGQVSTTLGKGRLLHPLHCHRRGAEVWGGGASDGGGIRPGLVAPPCSVL